MTAITTSPRVAVYTRVLNRIIEDLERGVLPGFDRGTGVTRHPNSQFIGLRRVAPLMAAVTLAHAPFLKGAEITQLEIPFHQAN